jgi:hypothetical protein
MTEEFIPLCETLWQDWLADSLSVSPFVHATFDMNAAPEPYISFDAGRRPLIALTTNPGQTMPHQLRSHVQQGNDLLNPRMAYAEAARELGSFYQQELPSGSPAQSRITKLLQLSTLLGTDGVLQIEICPFHSPLLNISKKLALQREASQDGLLARYVDAVQRYIASQSVVIVSAVGTRESLASGMTVSPWLTWLSEIAELDLKHASFVPLVSRETKTTCGAFTTSARDVMKAHVLMMGSNNLPSAEGLKVLSGVLRQPTS